MKSSTLSGLLAIYAVADAVALERRQLEPIGPMPTLKALEFEFVQPKYDPKAQKVRMVHGPYTIKGKDDPKLVGNSRSGDPHGSAYVAIADTSFPRDITLLHTDAFPAFRSEANKYTKLKLSDGLYIHHTLFADMNHTRTPFLSCGQKPVKMNPTSVFMAGAIQNSEHIFYDSETSVKSGYYIGPKSNILINVDVVNYNTTAQDIYLVSEMEYLPGKPKQFSNAENVVIDIGACSDIDGLDIRPPAGQTKWSINGTEMIVTQNGWLTQLGGHLHDGGTDIVLKANGNPICYSDAHYGGKKVDGKIDGKDWSSISDMTRCKEVKITQGEKLTITAQYDFNKYPPRSSSHGEMAEGMALMVGNFVPEQ